VKCVWFLDALPRQVLEGLVSGKCQRPQTDRYWRVAQRRLNLTASGTTTCRQPRRTSEVITQVKLEDRMQGACDLYGQL
jgi:hypothetical protein